MPRDNTRRIYALAWLSILVAACGGTVTSAGRDGGAGSSGSGGSGSSSGTGGTGGVSDNLVDAACGLMNALPCPLTNCEADLGEAVDEGEATGCGQLIADLLTCGNTHGWVCFGNAEHEEPYPPSDCDPILDSLMACEQQSSQDCAGTSNGSECSVYCTGSDTWGARCVDEGTYLSCTCDTGPHDGFAFTMSGDCSSDLSSVDSFCQ